MELSQDWHRRTNERLFDILSDIIKESKPPKVPKPTHGYAIAERAPEIVTAPGAYFPAKKGRVIPLESRQDGGAVTPTLTIRQMLDKLDSYGPSVARQNEGEVDPSLFKNTFSVNYGDTQQGIKTAANTALVGSTPINVSPAPTPSLQSFAPGADLTPAGPAAPPTGMAEYEANARKIRGLPPETGTPTGSPTDGRLNQVLGILKSFTPPAFKENTRSPVFGSDQRAAYDRKWKPYMDLMGPISQIPEEKTPLFPRDRGGVTSPDPLEGLSEEERKRRIALLRKEFPEETIASHGPTTTASTLSPDNMANVMTKGSVPKEEFTEFPKMEKQGDLSEIRKEILPSGETLFTLPGTEGTAKVGPERFFVGDKEVPAGTPGAVSGDKLARERILMEATPPTLKVPEKTYYEAHPEERFMDIGRAENKPLMDTYQKLVEENRMKAGGFGVPMNPKIAGLIRAEATRAVPELTKGLEQTMALNQATPEKYFSSEARGTATTPHVVQSGGQYQILNVPKKTPTGESDSVPLKITPTGLPVPSAPEDASEWRTHVKAGQEKGWTTEQILADWDRKQIDRAGKKAEVTFNAQVGGQNAFPMWDEATKKQSFENFIINNQKPTFAWRDAKSRNAWEEEFNKYLLEKGKTAESVGEVRFYRGAQKKALDNNEVYRVAAERFVNVIDQNAELVKKLKKQYGVNYGRLFNAAINNINQGVPGSGDLMALQQALTSLSNEVAKVESGSMGVAEVSVEQAKIWKRIHDYNLNEKDLDTVLDTSKKLGEIRRRSLRETTESLRKELGEKEVKPGEAPKPSGGTNRPRAADFAGKPEGGEATTNVMTEQAAREALRAKGITGAEQDSWINQYKDAGKVQ